MYICFAHSFRLLPFLLLWAMLLWRGPYTQLWIPAYTFLGLHISSLFGLDRGIMLFSMMVAPFNLATSRVVLQVVYNMLDLVILSFLFISLGFLVLIWIATMEPGVGGLDLHFLYIHRSFFRFFVLFL